MSCTFCKIINKEADARVEYEDDDTLVIHDKHPAAQTHLLVMPKKHYEKLMETPPGVMPKLFEVVQKVASKKGIDKDGFRVIINNGRGGGQVIPHVHIHLLAGGRLPGFH
jgi:histidine triad (HIT) family protein